MYWYVLLGTALGLAGVLYGVIGSNDTLVIISLSFSMLCAGAGLGGAIVEGIIATEKR